MSTLTGSSSELPVGATQLVEIAKAISQQASILILDEPTASLSAAEIDRLVAAVRRLAADGISVIYISHHLDEVLAICDRMSVLRDGTVTLVRTTPRTSPCRSSSKACWADRWRACWSTRITWSTAAAPRSCA